jgi:VCBS repeat-containing protein
VTIPVTVTDSAGATSTRNLEVTVTGTNDAPVVAPLTDTVDEDIASHSLDLLSGATDPEGDSLAVSGMQFTVNGAATSGPPPGVTIGADGHTLYIDTTGQAYQHLAPGQQEQIKVSYIVEDGHGGQTQQTATLTVEGQDDKATLVSNVIQMTETVAYETSMVGHSVRGHLQLNDPDDGAPREFVFSGSYAGQGYAPGHLYVWPDGSYEFNLEWASNRYARDAVNSLKSGETLEYKYNVQTADHQTKEVIIRITGEDDAARITVDPVLPARQTIYEDHLVPGGAGHNLYAGGILRVIDPDHDEAGIKPQSITTPEGGHFYIDARGSWSFVIGNSLPVVQQLGIGDSIVKTFTVESIDGSATHDIQVTIQGTNDAPVLTAQTQSVTEDGSLLSGQMVATDVDTGDTQAFTAANPPPGFTLNPDGSYSFDPTDPAYQQLAAGQTEKVTIPVTVTDSAGATSTRNLEVTVTGTDDAPVVSQAETLAPGTEDKAVTIDPADLLAHATDVDGDTLGVANLHADHGSLSLNPDGTYSFTPEKDYNGRVTFTYEVTDGLGGRVTQSASMNLAAVADKPVIDIDIADTADNVLNAKEITAATISGNIDAGSTLDSIDVTDGAQTITLQGANVTVDASGHYRVSGVDLSSLADGTLTVTAHATSTDGTTGISTDTITKDAAVGKISIHMENAGSDHEYSRAEVGSDGTVTATISLPQDALAGDTLTVNSVDHVLTTQDISAGQVDYQVHPSDSLIAVLTDQAGNRSDVESVQVANLAPDHPTFVTPPVIQNHGVPTITATIGDGSGGSGGWALEGPDGRAVQQVTGKYGTLTIDPQTGQLSYEYSHAATMGQKAQGGTHSAGETISQTDHDVFHVLLHSSRHGDVDVEVNIDIEFIHGRSGQNRDSTQLVSMTIIDPAGGQANDEIPDQADVFSATLDAADDEQPQGDTVSEYVNIFAQAGADVHEPERGGTRSADLPEGLEAVLSENGAQLHEVGPDHSLDPAALASVLDHQERHGDDHPDLAQANLDQPSDQAVDELSPDDPTLQQQHE